MIVLVGSFFFTSDITKTIKKETYISSVDLSTRKIISNAHLYNKQLEDLYSEIDHDFFNKTFVF